jgi:uncharacterized protein (DUF885 family)
MPSIDDIAAERMSWVSGHGEGWALYAERCGPGHRSGPGTGCSHGHRLAAPSYKLGEQIWLPARQDAMARAGAAFSLKDFHAKALSLGAMGLDPLREELARV